MSKSLKYFYLVLAVIILVAGSSFFYRQAVTAPAGSGSERVNFVITPGQGVQEIAEDLKEEKLLNSVFLFQAYVWEQDKEKNFQAGSYSLDPDMSIQEIVNKITSGDTLGNTETIKTIEGWRLDRIAQHLESKELFPAEEFLEVAGYPLVNYSHNNDLPAPRDFSDTFPFLRSKPSEYGLEGYLFPDTYEIYSDASPDDVVIKMLSNFDNKVTDEMMADIEKQGKTLHEIVTMASLLEKEVQTEEDMKIVSGVFWKKIGEDDALRSCASLAYILGEDKARYSTEDTKIESPFNTYQNAGLPPAPVGNPGLQAIKAAIYPTETDYNYFLSPVGSDETIFSRTWEEHLRNKDRYLN